MDVNDKITVITGAANGIGAAMARCFAEHGARHVVLADVDESNLALLAAEIGGHPVPCDVSTHDAVTALIDHVEHDVGPIDLFCSNAGVFAFGGIETDDEVWRRCLDINVMAHVFAARALVPRMVARGGGYLLQTASAAGLLCQIGSATYSVTKHAAIALAEWIAITYGASGIKVSVLCPQAVRTNMTAGIAGGGVAGVDGMLEPDDVAASVIEGLVAERFLILPHPTVAQYMQRKASDYDRWLDGMRRLQTRFMGSD